MPSESDDPDLVAAKLVSAMEQDQAELLGEAILLLANPRPDNRWIRRRVDTLTFLDEHTIQRRVSLDLDLFALSAASESEKWPTFAGHLFLPLAMLPKAPRRAILVEDEAHNQVPRLTKLERLPLMRAGLLRLARVMLDKAHFRYDDAALQSISALVEEALDTAPTQEARTKAKNDLRQQRGAQGGARHPAIRTVLSQDSFWHPLLDLVDHYYLLVPIPLAMATRRVLSYQYLDTVHPVVRQKGRMETLKGLIQPPEFSFELDAPAVAESDTFHLDIEAPYDLRVSRVVMKVDFAGQADTQSTFPNDDRHFARAHIFCSISEPVKKALVTGALRPVASGMLRSAAIASSLVAAVLIAGSIGLLGGVIAASNNGGRESIDPSAAAALLLLVPGVFATYLSQASRHGLTSKVNFRVRAILGLSSLCSFSAASAVAIGLRLPWFERVWYVAAVTSVCVSLILVLKFVTNSSDMKQVLARSYPVKGDHQNGEEGLSHSRR